MAVSYAPPPRPALPPIEALRGLVAPFERPDERRALAAFATSLPPFVVGWWLMYRSLALPYAVTLALAVPTAGFLVRTFIVAHDCGHGSFFRSARRNVWIGRLCAAPALVPFGYWRRMHATHHATAAKLDRRGTDVATLTVREYRARSRAGRIGYRVLRHPFLLFGVGPLLYFGVLLRLPWIAPPAWRRERRSIVLTDLALAALVAAVVRAVGARAFVRVHLPVAAIAAAIGVWLFYVQHQFEDTYWAPDGEWDYGRAALEGSSYLVLPPVLAWFTGYIGLHHVHHLSPRVPSYQLAACVRANPALDAVPRLTLAAALRTARLKLWDEERRQLVGWRDADQSRSA